MSFVTELFDLSQSTTPSVRMIGFQKGLLEQTMLNASRMLALKPGAVCQTLADAITLAANSMNVGETVTTKEYNAGTNVGANVYVKEDAGDAASRPAADGGSIIYVGSEGLYLRGLFSWGVWIEQFGAYHAASDNYTAITNALNYGSKNYIGAISGLAKVYKTSPLIIPKNVNLQGPNFNALSVHHMVSLPAETTGVLVISAIADSTGNFILFDGNSMLSGLKNLIIDARNHDGDVVVLGDSGNQIRNNNHLDNVIIFEGSGTQLKLTALNKGANLSNVFCRGGVDYDNAISAVGIHDQSQDSKWEKVFCAFHTTRGIIDNAGAGRRRMVDAWGCLVSAVEVMASATYERLQTDHCGDAGLILNGCQNAQFIAYNSNNNGQSGGITGDVKVMGDCSGTVFTSPAMKGSDTPIVNAFEQEASSKAQVQIVGGSIATGYSSVLNDIADAYWDADYKFSNLASIPRQANAIELNPNPVLNNIISDAPNGWTKRNAGLATLETSDLPVGHVTATKITSSATGTSGIQFSIGAVDDHKGKRIKVTALVKGSGLTYQGNQRLQIYDGITNPIVTIPADSTWKKIAMVYDVPITASVLTIRLIAANDGTSGLELLVTGLSIKSY